MTSPQLLDYAARAARSGQQAQPLRPEHSTEGQPAPQKLGTPIEWAADTLGACVLLLFIVAAFFVLGMLTDKGDGVRLDRHNATIIHH